MNMTRPRPPAILEPYRPVLQRWLAHVEIDVPPKLLRQFDAIATWKGPTQALRYLVELKRHLQHQDVAVVIDRLKRRRAELPPNHARDRLLLLAPYVRPQQAEALERAGVDYLDLAGNAHLEAPGLFVHVEGRRARERRPAAPGRPQRAWIKTVMALLVRPELAQAPYRTIAERADVALGTVATCMNDLTRRGLLVGRKGNRRIADRDALVALWVPAYVEGLRPRLDERRFQVRADGKQEIWTRLQTVFAERRQRWALTGADAAEREFHYFRTEETEIYAPAQGLEDREAQRALRAQPAVRGGNLLVIEPPGPLALPDATAGQLPVAPDLLVYAELRYRGTTQALEAAELLLPRVLGHAAH